MIRRYFFLAFFLSPVFLGAAVSTETVTSVTVSSSNFMTASLALDGSNNVHMVYFDTATVKLNYGKLLNGTTTWAVTPLSSKQVAPQADLALSPAGTPHVIFYQTESPAGVKHAQLSGSSWVEDPVENFVGTNTFVSIAVGTDNVPRVVYNQSVSSSTWFGERFSGVWVTTETLIVPAGPFALALDESNDPHFLSIVDYLGKRYVYYAERLDSGYYIEGSVQVNSVSLNGTRKIGMAIDKQGRSHMSYFDEGIGGLMYGVYDGVTLSTSTLDAAPGAGTFSSIAVDGRDKPMIVYFSSGIGLRSAVYDTSWTLSTLESGLLNGVGPSVTFNRYHHYLAGYLNGDTNELKFITNANRGLSLSGTVLNFSGSPIPGVSLSLSGNIAPKSVVVSSTTGAYSVDHLFEGVYTLVPSKSDHAFLPPSLTFSPLQTSRSVQNFEGGALNFSPVGNLFNPQNGEQVMFTYSIIPGTVSIKILSLRGVPIRTLVDEHQAAGTYSVFWDGRTTDGNVVSSGIYLVYFEANQTKSVKKVAVVK